MSLTSDEKLLKEIDYKFKEMLIKLDSECRRCDEKVFCLGCKYHYLKKKITELSYECFIT